MKKRLRLPPGRRDHRDRERGATLIFLIICMAIFAALGTAMVSLFGTASLSQFMPNQVRRANYMAESGLRFALAEGRNSSNVVSTLLAMNNRTFNITPNVETFNIRVYPYWFRVTGTGAVTATINATDHARAIPCHAHDAPVFPMGHLVLVGELLDAKQILGGSVLFCCALDLLDVARPGSLLQFVE